MTSSLKNLSNVILFLIESGFSYSDIKKMSLNSIFLWAIMKQERLKE